MRVLIVDDEAPARARLRRLLERMEGVEVCGEASSGTQAAERIVELSPDLVLLDIQMPGLDGFGVVERVGVNSMPPVIFVTAYDEHALRAFEVHALDYLLKPVSPERLTRAIERVRALTSGRDAPDDDRAPEDEQPDGEPGVANSLDARLKALLESVGRSSKLKHLLVQANERAYLLPVEELVRATVDRNYVRLFTKTASYRIRGTIGALAERLEPDDFLRLSRSDLVRVSEIREMHPWSHGDYHVILRDGTRLIWSRRYRARAEGRFLGG
jgi:two-component system LytT family response regulator